ncbi:hypothetical protein CEXT_210641 [Caerostris extrusa]|uniref:Uncharacterized protein n=1 Tax=Caerostris extrusa TaxID=172846 RepID=A0AAV4XJE4_CAEEX|nr:hypothetical protein CEXT_210641 [Caerostris extrusa]
MLNNFAPDITAAITTTPTWHTALRQGFIIATNSFRAPSEFNFTESFISVLLRNKGSYQKWNLQKIINLNQYFLNMATCGLRGMLNNSAPVIIITLWRMAHCHTPGNHHRNKIISGTLRI